VSGDDMLGMILKGQEKLETEIRQIREAMVRLARIEERHTAHSDTLTRYGKRLDNHGNRIREVERVAGINSKSTGLFDRIVERALMILVGGGITAVFIFKLGGG